jgi:hypothetical protein
MPRVGRPPKPIEEKRRLGNPGKRALPDGASLTVLPGASEPPEPRRPLGRHGRELWNEIWTSPAAWLAPGVDSEHVLVLCELLDERVALRATVLRAQDRHERRALRALDTEYLGALADLGLNPVERARLGVAEVKKPSSTLDAIAERRAKRS